jgi:hypothetical protein
MAHIFYHNLKRLYFGHFFLFFSGVFKIQKHLFNLKHFFSGIPSPLSSSDEERQVRGKKQQHK